MHCAAKSKKIITMFLLIEPTPTNRTPLRTHWKIEPPGVQFKKIRYLVHRLSILHLSAINGHVQIFSISHCFRQQRVFKIDIWQRLNFGLTPSEKFSLTVTFYSTGEFLLRASQPSFGSSHKWELMEGGSLNKKNLPTQGTSFWCDVFLSGGLNWLSLKSPPNPPVQCSHRRRFFVAVGVKNSGFFRHHKGWVIFLAN